MLRLVGEIIRQRTTCKGGGRRAPNL